MLAVRQIAHGSERSVSLLTSHKHYIRALESFKHVDPSTGRDDGVNVRKKSEKIMELLNDPSRVTEARSA